MIQTIEITPMDILITLVSMFALFALVLFLLFLKNNQDDKNLVKQKAKEETKSRREMRKAFLSDELEISGYYIPRREAEDFDKQLELLLN